MIMRMKCLFVLIIFFTAVCASAKAHAVSNCATALDLSALNSEWARASYQDLQAAPVSIAVLPFSPVMLHKEVPPYFPYVFPVLLGDYWPPSSPVRAADWRLTLQALRHLSVASVSSGSTFDNTKVIEVGEQLKVKYLIAGSFDLYQNRIKVFVRYYDIAKKQLVSSANLTLASNVDVAFLLLIGQIAQGASQAFPRVSVDRTLYQALTHSFSKFDVLKDYMQGVSAGSIYDPNGLSVAKVWLKNAIGKDYRFFQAYRELARVHYMSAQIAKQQLLDPSSEYLEADHYLNQASQYAVVAAHPQDWLNRFIEGKVNSTLGMNFFKKSDFAKARLYFEQARAFTPEDGLNQYYLALTYQSLGLDALAKQPWAVANQINPCFKNAGIGI